MKTFESGGLAIMEYDVGPVDDLWGAIRLLSLSLSNRSAVRDCATIRKGCLTSTMSEVWKQISSSPLFHERTT